MSINSSLSTNAEPEFGYGQILSILIRRFMWVGGTVIVSVALALLSTIREEPVYESSMQLLIEPNYRETVDITEQEAAASSASQVDYVTQLNLMQSETFIQQTVDRMLEDYPNFCGSDSGQDSSCAKRYQNALALAQVVEDDTATRIFSARFKANDPIVVKDFLEKLGEVYLNYNEEQQDQRLEEGLALVNQQIKEVQGNLTESRQELKQFRREAGALINPREEALEVARAMRDVEKSRNDTGNQLLEAQAEYDALQGQLSSDLPTAFISSRLSQSPRYQKLLNRLQEIEIQLDERLALYAEADPGVQSLTNQRQRHIALLQEEVQRIFGTVPAQLNLDEDALLTEGQLSEIEIDLVGNLVRTEVHLQSLNARQQGLNEIAETLQARLDTFPDLISAYDRIQPEVDIQEKSLQKLLQIRQKLSNEIAQGGFSWDVVEAPRVGRKIAPLPKRNIMMGLIAGVFLGGALAFGRDSMDKSVRTSDQLKKQSTFPLLGIIPEIPTKTLGPFALLAKESVIQSTSKALDLSQYKPFRDAVDLTYKTIQLSSSEPLTSVMVTSASVEDGKTTLAVGLALSAARSHQRVLLLDCNLRNPSLHNYFDLPNEQGLSTQLPEHSFELNNFRIALTTVSVEGINIDVLPAGPVPKDPMSILSSLQMRCFLTQAEATYDLVIIDSPPILGLADSLQIASMCKASVMVSRLDQTTQADLNQAMAVLKQINTIGIIANGHHTSSYPEAPYESNGQSKSLIREPIMLWQK